MEAVQFLIYPFLGCLILVLIHAYFGVHILERGVIFLDLSLAQFIAVGIAFSFFMGDNVSIRYIYAAVFAVLGASILSLSKQIARYVNIEAFIGVLYVFSFAVSILILDRTAHGLEEFKSILNGNILWLTPADVLKASLLYAGIGGLHVLFWKRFINLSYGNGKNFFWEFLFFLTFAFVLVSSVQIAGILQVFAFLVIPALIGRLYTRDPVRILLKGWAIGLAVSLLGISLSYKLDVPTAPLIVAFLSLIFFVLLGSKARRRNKENDDSPGGKHGLP
ncbi:MAG: metal ABC transporter permease [Thermodesulfobacteriota bacterium]|jgi:zinc/manganese transport system permease protein